MQVSDARFVMLVHGAIIISLITAVTMLVMVGKGDAQLTAVIYGGALGYAGGRTMNSVRSPSDSGGV